MKKKYFGTDGIRGQVGQAPITADFMLHLGWAAGKVFSREGRSKVLIGKDTRISGYMFESALEAGLVAAGVDVRLLGPMPTPAIAYLTRTLNAQAGIVISASHNAYQDNGIKFFCGQGSKLPDEVELAIEAQLEQPMTTADSAELGKVQRVSDAEGRYMEFCKRAVPAGFSLKGLKVVLDCAHGATYHVAPQVFREMDAEVIAIGVEPDGLNINRGVGSTQPQTLVERVQAEQADLGIAFDGDGDRVIFVDHLGEVVDGDELLFIIARDQMRTQGYCEGVVGTLMSNLGFELALEELEIPFVRANVGDRYVKELMLSRGWELGGENSGHIICGDVTTTGDGLVAALKVVFALVDTGCSLHEAKQGMKKFPQIMHNVRTAGQFNLAEHDGLRSVIAEVEQRLGHRGRVLLRPSGTEPVVRVMVEGEHHDEVSRLCQDLAKQVQEVVG